LSKLHDWYTTPANAEIVRIKVIKIGFMLAFIISKYSERAALAAGLEKQSTGHRQK